MHILFNPAPCMSAPMCNIRIAKSDNIQKQQYPIMTLHQPSSTPNHPKPQPLNSYSDSDIIKHPRSSIPFLDIIQPTHAGIIALAPGSVPASTSPADNLAVGELAILVAILGKYWITSASV